MATTATSVSGIVGAVVAPPPAVKVTDQFGEPMGGVPVTFAIVSGGGSVTGATVTTDSSGNATVGSWTLGPAAGANVLGASSGSLTRVDFTATATAGTATSIAKNGGDNQSAIAGSAVAIPPSVILKDAGGNAVPGMPVTFSVVSGGGSVTGGTVTTNASGIATVGSWTLGPTAGANVLRATSATLGSVDFAATSGVGAAASIAKNAGDNQSATAGIAVPIPPSVIVRDANNNPKPGVAVTFAVVSGGGSITGAAAVTNASGIATVGMWTLGTVGPNSLSATTAGLPPVTFNATAVSSFCTVRSPHTFGSVSQGTLSSSDCQFSDGSFVDFFTTSVPQTGAYLFRQGAAWDTYLLLAMPDGTTIGENDDEIPPATNSAIKALLPAGNYLLAPGSIAPEPGQPAITGDYEMSSTTTSSDVVNCEQVFVVKGVSTAQSLAATDCNLAGPGAPAAYADGYFIFMNAGSSITVDMTSGAVNSFLQVVQLNGQIVGQNDNRDGSTNDSRLTFTAPQTNYYVIFARSATTSAVGAYSLSIQ